MNQTGICKDVDNDSIKLIRKVLYCKRFNSFRSIDLSRAEVSTVDPERPLYPNWKVPVSLYAQLINVTQTDGFSPLIWRTTAPWRHWQRERERESRKPGEDERLPWWINRFHVAQSASPFNYTLCLRPRHIITAAVEQTEDTAARPCRDTTPHWSRVKWTNGLLEN